MPQSRRRFLFDSAAASAALFHPGVRLFAADDTKPKKQVSPFLQGNFAPIREEFTEDKLRVTGNLPKGLEGLFVRNGPNPQFDPLGNYHWFDGDGMLHGVLIRDGKASYRNRFIRTKKYQDEKAAGKAIYSGILDMPDLTKVVKGENPFQNPANTALVYHNKKLLALYEAAEPWEVKVPGLETVGPYLFGGKLMHPFTAHPKLDPTTGEMLTFGYIPNRPLVLFSTVNANGELVRTVPVKLDRPAMIHDFVITPKYAVFPAWPQTFDMTRMFKGQSPWFFDREKLTNWVLVPRTGDGKPLSFEAKTAFAFHLLNAHESGDEIVVIGCRYPRFPGSLTFGETDSDQSANAAVPYRWRLNTKTNAVTEGPIDDTPAEFPRHNDAFVGKEIRYGYFGIGDGEFFDGLRKYDLTTGKPADHKYGDGRFGGEGVFVPRPDSKSEDDGWLLTYLFDKGRNASELVVIDAADMKAQPVARIHLPTRVPYGFHGTWVPVDRL